jgi:4-amino-4-deoxy-L-arabinose transferase-like glycosyltransferase
MGVDLHASFAGAAQRVISRDSPLAIFALVLLFLGGLAPYAAFFLTYHPDERHYTDAGIEMVRRGDYLTPYTADGELRLKKPIIPYWITAVSYRLFGISPASSRLPFLLAGGGVVCLTYYLALTLLQERRWALLAAWMAAGNPSLLISAPRSAPDVVLAMFLLLSALGFASMLREGQTRWINVLAAYGGGALAVLSKGLPAVVFLAYAVGFFALMPSVRRRQCWPRHVAGSCGGTLLAASWFAVMFRWHGDALTTAFFHDQIGEERMAGSLAKGLTHFLEVVLLIGVSFLPWIVPLAASRQDLRPWARGLVRQTDHLFLLGWIVIWIGLASSVERVNLRYLLPIAPLLSVLAAAAWRQADAARLARAALPGWRLAIFAFAIAALFSVGVVAQAGRFGTALLVLVVAAAMLAMLVSWSREADALRLASLGLACCFALLAIVSVGLMPLRLPDIGWTIAQEVRRTAELIGHPPRAVYVGEPSVAARARVYSRGELELRQTSNLDPAVLQNANIVLMARDDEIPGEPWIPVRSLTNGYRAIHAPDLVRAALDGRLDSYLQARRQHVTIAVRSHAADASPQQTARRDSDSLAPDAARRK